MLDFFAGDGGTGEWVNRNPLDDYWYESRIQAGTSGIAIDERNAPEMPAVWACVGKNAKTLASLPVHVYEKTGDRTRRLVDHELNDILTWNGNSRSTGVSVRAAQVANRLLWGNSVSEIVYANGSNKIREIIPLESRFIRPAWNDDGELLWEHLPNGQYDTTLTPDKYLHEPGHFSYNGVLGISAVKYCRECIAAGRAAEIFGASFFGNGAVPGGTLEFPADLDLSDERMDYLVQKFNENFQGPGKAHRVGRLREGVKFNQYQMPLEDMQFLELQKFNRIQICMIFDTPPVMIQELDPGKYTAIEQAMIAWVRDSLLPQVTNTEMIFKRRFFRDKPKLYLKYNLAGLARGDMAARSQFYKEGITWGWFTQNDVREMEELDPVEGGDTNWIGANMMPLTMGGSLIQQKASGNGSSSTSSSDRPPVIVVPVNVIGTQEQPSIDVEAIGRQVAETIARTVRQPAVDVSATFGPLLADVAKRIVTKEIKAVKTAIKRHQDSEDAYLAWCDSFFTSHMEYVSESIDPIVTGIESATGKVMSERPSDFAASYCEHQLRTARGIPAGGAELDADYLAAKLKATYLVSEKSLCLTT